MVLGAGCAILLQDDSFWTWVGLPVLFASGAMPFLVFRGVLFGVGGDAGPGEDIRDGLPEVRGPGLVGGSVGKAADEWVRGMAYIRLVAANVYCIGANFSQFPGSEGGRNR